MTSISLPLARGRLVPRGLLGTYVFVAWVTFTTVDPISVGGVLPLKLFLLGLALVTWYPERTGKPIPYVAPVIFVAVGVPILWSLVALYYPHPYAGLTPSPLQLTLEHASHFVYLLIYLPFADALLHRDRERTTAMWLAPAVLLCAITWLLYVLYVRLGIDIGVTRLLAVGESPSQLGPLAGIVNPPGAETRIFFANHILLVPATAILLGIALRTKVARWVPWTLLFTVATLVPIHTRGLTIGVATVIVVVALLSWRVGSAWPVALLAISLVLLLGTSFDPRVAAVLSGDLSDASSQQRITQAPQLLEEFKRRPLLGSGLGATLPSGTFRSAEQPFSFELTYHDVLFHNGIVGLLAILGLPLLAMARTVAVMTRLSRDERALAIAAVAAMAGLLVAGATNPYLISSFGMLATTVALAYCARAVSCARP